MSYAGRFAQQAPIHQALAQLHSGCRVRLLGEGDDIMVMHDSVTIAKLSHNAAAFWRERLNAIESTTVIAMIRRYRQDSEEPYLDQCRVESWEIRLLEIVLRMPAQ